MLVNTSNHPRMNRTSPCPTSAPTLGQRTLPPQMSTAPRLRDFSKVQYKAGNEQAFRSPACAPSLSRQCLSSGKDQGPPVLTFPLQTEEIKHRAWHPAPLYLVIASLSALPTATCLACGQAQSRDAPRTDLLAEWHRGFCATLTSAGKLDRKAAPWRPDLGGTTRRTHSPVSTLRD